MSADKVIIIDDDSTLRQALEKVITQAGYEVFSTESTLVARDLIENNAIKIWIVDCLLPNESGVDFVKTATSEGLTFDYLLLTSGFFTDPVFVKDAITETKASNFLAKPFDNKKLIELLPKPASDTKLKSDSILESQRKIYQTLAVADRDPKFLLKILDQIEFVSGYDLPFIYNLLLESRVSGFLNLSAEDGRIFGVTFAGGAIVRVDFEDTDTRVGRLLIENGFINSGELELALSKKNSGRIGEFLMANHYISPHAFEIVMAEQMSLRLSNSIIDQDVQFNFASANVAPNQVVISMSLFDQYLHDWVNSKINELWLKARLDEWRFTRVRIRSSHNEILLSLKNLQIFQSFPEILDSVLSQPLLNELMINQSTHEKELIKMVFLLATKGVIFFSDEDVSLEGEKMEELQSLFNSIANIAPEKVYQVILHFFKLENNQVAILNAQVASYLAPFEKSANSECSNLALQFKKRWRLAREVQEQVMSKPTAINSGSLDAIKYLDEGKALIKKGLFLEAIKKIESSLGINSKIPGQIVYLIWAQVSLPLKGKTEPDFLKQIESLFLRVDPEEKHEPLFFFVQGLYFKRKSNYGNAVKAFEKALSLDSQFIQARRELMVVKPKVSTKKGNILEADLKDLVGQIFSKKR